MTRETKKMARERAVRERLQAAKVVVDRVFETFTQCDPHLTRAIGQIVSEMLQDVYEDDRPVTPKARPAKSGPSS